eukprot:scaffold965_cov262-Pinguiococcus_pyrenoidosus.AAC.8
MHQVSEDNSSSVKVAAHRSASRQNRLRRPSGSGTFHSLAAAAIRSREYCVCPSGSSQRCMSRGRASEALATTIAKEDAISAISAGEKEIKAGPRTSRRR